MKTIKVALFFPREKIEEPAICNLSKNYNLVFSILAAEIYPGESGRTILSLTGTEENLEKGLEYCRNLGLDARRFEKSILHDREKCIDCGACTAVCIPSALYLDEESTLNFDAEKCHACGHCIKACPMRAIDLDVFI
jgi:L-aspartate semialdehyde sulfurtransferase ferredoxin